MKLSEFRQQFDIETADMGDLDPEVVVPIIVAPGRFVWFDVDKVYTHEMGLVIEVGRKIK